jgi:hypothetical protein
MTHDQLIKDLDSCIKGAEYGPYEWGFIALRAIVELHKRSGGWFCDACTKPSDEVFYPCPTIQAIEKELE